MLMIEYQEYLGVNVAKQVLELMNAIKIKNPILQFTVGSNRTTFFDDATPPNRIEVKTSLLAQDVSDPSKSIGSIGYDTDEKYWVRSRLIQNEKYGRWNTSQHQSKCSKHMKNIVKEALKSLRPLEYEEIKAEHEGDMNRQIDHRSRQVVAKSNTTMRLEFAEIFPELLHMHNTGYTPTNPKVAQAISYAVENKEELEKYYRYNPKKCMIWVRPNSVVYEIDKVVSQVNTTAELPEDLRGKLFVLDVTDKGQFVEDVGMKQDGGVYWVLLEEK
jgi:hypothetical protein